MGKGESTRRSPGEANEAMVEVALRSATSASSPGDSNEAMVEMVIARLTGRSTISRGGTSDVGVVGCDVAQPPARTVRKLKSRDSGRNGGSTDATVAEGAMIKGLSVAVDDADRIVAARPNVDPLSDADIASACSGRSSGYDLAVPPVCALAEASIGRLSTTALPGRDALTANQREADDGGSNVETGVPVPSGQCSTSTPIGVVTSAERPVAVLPSDSRRLADSRLRV